MSTSRTHHGIVVGVDGSPPSKVAVDWAAREALLRNLPLTIIHVIPSPMVSMAPGVLMLPELTVQLEKHGQEVLRDARRIAEQAAAGSNAISVDTEVITAGVLPTLIDLSKEADMIVVGCRGLGAIGRRLLGSVSSGLLHHAHCPVAVIHDEDPLMPHARDGARRGRDRRFTGVRGGHRDRLRRGVAARRGTRRRSRLERLRGRRAAAWHRVVGLHRDKPRRRWPSGSPDGRSAIPT